MQFNNTLMRRIYIVTEVEYQKHYYPGSRSELVRQLKNSLDKQSRFEHCLRVEQMAVQLAKLNHEDVEKAAVAGLIHDYAKERTAKEFKQVIIAKKMDPDLLNWGNFIWHGEVGAEIIKNELKIMDEEILNAIRRHTVGAVQMTTLDKIVYVADYIEPGRDFPGVNYAREVAFADLDDGVRYETQHTLQYLLENNQKIYPAAILTYNQWNAKN